jgi:hypothetical protein
VKPRLEAPEEALERLDAEELTAGEQARLWQRLDASTAAPRPRGRLVLGVAFAATVLVVALFFVVRRNGDSELPVASSCDLDPGQTELRLGAGCGEREVRVAGDEWRLKAGTAVARLDDGARGFASR